MPEYPIILAHNVLDGAVLTGNDITDHELERLRDGHRHTWWESPSTAAQTIVIKCANLLENGDFEIDASGWQELEAGGGAGAFTRNTTTPLEGVGDMQVVVTTADSNTLVYMVVAPGRPIFMRAGRTYRFSFQAISTLASRQIWFGFVDEDFTENAAYRTSGVVDTAAGEYFFDYTPAADGVYHPYIRFRHVSTFNIDEMVCNEVRDVDTLIIDGGHTLRYASIAVQYSVAGLGAGGTVAYPTTFHYKDEPLYITFAGVKALHWKVIITITPNITGAPVAKVPAMYLGKRWTLPHHFSGSFDPHRNDRFDDEIKSDMGIMLRMHKYNQRMFSASMSHLSTTDYENVKHFFEDTLNGARPFFFIWQPTTDPTDAPFLRLKGSRDIPYQGGALRSWGFEAEEVVGQRKLGW